MVGRSDEEVEGDRYQMKEKGSDKGERARGNHTMMMSLGLAAEARIGPFFPLPSLPIIYNL
jgi:hypothetical protein